MVSLQILDTAMFEATITHPPPLEFPFVLINKFPLVT